MKNKITLFLFIFMFLLLTGCGEKYIPVENTSGFTVENMTLIEQLEGSTDIYFESDLENSAFKVDHLIFLYQVDNNTDESYQYVVALELSINPQENYKVSCISIEISNTENIQIEYNDSMLIGNNNSYDLNYEDHGSSIAGHVDVGYYFQSKNGFTTGREGNEILQFFYRYTGSAIFFRYNDYSKDPSMQKALFVLKSDEPLTSLSKDNLKIELSGASIENPTHSLFYDLLS